MSIVLSRVSLAAITLWIFVFAFGFHFPRHLKVWFTFLIMGLLNNAIPFTLIVWGQSHIASSLAAILNATTPLFAGIIAGIFLSDEKVTPMKLIGVFIGFVGVVIMIGPNVLVGLGAEVIAQIAILCASLSYAFAGVFGRRFKAMKVVPVVTAAGQVTASIIVLLPLTMLLEPPWELNIPSVNTVHKK